MTSYIPAKKNTAYVFDIGLDSVGTPGTFQTNPTLAAGDVKVSIDNGAQANLATLPIVSPAGGKIVKVALSAAEMNGDNIIVQFSDQTNPAEWKEAIIDIPTSTNQIDDLATAATVPTANANADALLDRAAGIETNITPRQGLRVLLAAVAGRLSGASTTQVKVRDTTNTKDRITATVDTTGNRTNITLDVS